MAHITRAIAGARPNSAGGDSGIVWEMLKLLPLESKIGLLKAFSEGDDRPKHQKTQGLGFQSFGWDSQGAGRGDVQSIAIHWIIGGTIGVLYPYHFELPGGWGSVSRDVDGGGLPPGAPPAGLQK